MWNDVCDIFDVDKATFYYIKDEVIIAINKAFNFKFDITDESQIKDLMAGFRRKSAPGLIDRCFGCLDGWAPVLQRPSKKKVKNRHRLYLRKQYYTISVQAICCPKGYFLWYDMRCTGNTHDSTTFAITAVQTTCSFGTFTAVRGLSSGGCSLCCGVVPTDAL